MQSPAIIAPRLPKKESEEKELDVHAKKDLVFLVYKTILDQLDQGEKSHTFKTLIKRMPEHEIDMEWQAIADGTVPKALKAMLSGKMDREDLEGLANLYNGIAVPYFRSYHGEVPKEDMQWAHQQIKHFFDKVDEKIPALPSNDKKLLESFTKKVLAVYKLQASLPWSKPDFSGRIELESEKYIAYIAPYKEPRRFEWDVSKKTGESIDAGETNTIEEAKQIIETEYNNVFQKKA